MKALIYNPYLDTLGGGERYCLTVGEYFLKKKWEVFVVWKDKEVIKKAQERFNLNLEGLKILNKKLERLSFEQKFRTERQFDLIFWVSDGSIPFLFGRKNFLHFQVPFVRVRGKNLLNKIKLKLVDKIVCNSRFTKSFVDREFGVNSVVLYPPVDVEKFAPLKKENIILGVGRFEETMQAKRQDVLIEAFSQMVKKGLRNWRLVLIGGSLGKKNDYLAQLKEKARGLPVEFLVNVPFEVLKTYYGKAKIFWHAAGFGIEEEKYPYRVEHFGMTTVEAMAAGCVPIVIDKGGLREIVRRGVGERWRTIAELEKATFKVIQDSKLWRRYSLKAQQESVKFSKKIFFQSLERIIKDEENS